MKILVTGGCSFIGSNLVEYLLKERHQVRVIDDLSSGSIENIQDFLDWDNLSFEIGDLLCPLTCQHILQDIEVVFHLAARHGGRFFVDNEQELCTQNYTIDSNVFSACVNNNVKKLIYASSACVYPIEIQKEGLNIPLVENLTDGFVKSDNVYGEAKLAGEKKLQKLYQAGVLDVAICRFFCVYGPKSKEDHALTAFIAKSIIKQNPFEIWGKGTQIRSWLYIDDAVNALILSSKIITKAKPINIATTEHFSVNELALKITGLFGYEPTYYHDISKPSGPYSRIADNLLAKTILGWSPKIKIDEGLKRTVQWYKENKKSKQLEFILENKLKGIVNENFI